MLLSKFARRIGVTPEKIHPSFGTFDRIVTTLVFIDIIPRVGHLIEFLSAIVLSLSIHNPFRAL